MKSYEITKNMFSMYFFHYIRVRYKKTLPIYKHRATIPLKETGCLLGCGYFMAWANELEQQSSSYNYACSDKISKFSFGNVKCFQRRRNSKH